MPNQNNRGRPRMAQGEVKSHTFSVRLTPDERALIEAAAERAGATSASDWARDALLLAAGAEAQPPSKQSAERPEKFHSVDCRIIIAITGSGHWWATGSYGETDESAVECATDFAITEATDHGVSEKEAEGTVRCYATMVRIPERLKHVVHREIQLTAAQPLEPDKEEPSAEESP